MSKVINRFVRGFIPSTALLSHSRVFTALLYLVELIPRTLIRSFTKSPLPPSKYIVRIGVGNTIWKPHYWYLNSSTSAWMYFLSKRMIDLDSIVVDIGSGIGRSAVGLRDFSYHGAGFNGHYYGFDIDLDMVRWCQDNFPSKQFTFKFIDAPSSIYNPDGQSKHQSILIDELTNKVDFVFSQSLFTHLLEDNIKHYILESYNLLRPEGVMAMTFFCMDDLKALDILGGRWTFKHRLGNAYIENEKYPEAAVGYEQEWIIKACLEAGFSKAYTDLADFQSTLIAIK